MLNSGHMAEVLNALPIDLDEIALFDGLGE